MLHAIAAYEDVMRDLEVKMDKDRQRKRQLERRQHRKNRDAFEVGAHGEQEVEGGRDFTHALPVSQAVPYFTSSRRT